MIYIGAHQVQNHKYGVTGCTIKIYKFCTYVTPKYANCGAKHQVTIFRCPARLKTLAKA